MTPEDSARQNIDRQLTECGWIVQNMSDMNIMSGQGVAVRELQLTTGEADHGLYIDGMHSDDIVKIVREEFGRDNDFSQKITSKSHKPDELLQSFRNTYNPRVAVTVDMIATGTDVKHVSGKALAEWH